MPQHEHEQFTIDGRRAAQQLRQDRFEPAEWSCRLVVGGRELAVHDYSAFGVAVVAATPVDCDGVVAAPLLLLDVEVARLRLSRVRVEMLADGRYKTAFAIVGEPLSLTRIDALGRAQEAAATHARFVESVAAVPAPFKLEVYQARDALEELERLVAGLDGHAPHGSAAEAREFEAAVAEVIAAHLDRLFATAYAALAAAGDALDGVDAERCHAFFRRELRHLLYQSPLFERSYDKPLGYAGDYEMMNLVYRNENLGRTLFARCLSRYYIDHPNARAVRNRPAYLLARIRARIAAAGGRPVRILSVASGPAREIQMLLDDAAFDPALVEVELLDQDAAALRNAQDQIRRIAQRRGWAAPVGFLHKAMANVLTGGLDGRYDLIYSAGLFDYFSDPLARRAASRLYRLLDEGGELVIGNFQAIPQHRAFMELALDWRLTYRTADELRALYHGIARALDVDAEPEAINLFVTLRR